MQPFKADLRASNKNLDDPRFYLNRFKSEMDFFKSGLGGFKSGLGNQSRGDSSCASSTAERTPIFSNTRER